MDPSITHPFSVDVRLRPGSAATYRWSIRKRGGSTHYSSMDYATFDEARVAVKHELGRMIMDWQIG